MKSISRLGKLTFAAVLTAGFAVLPAARAGTLFVNAGAPGCSPAGRIYCEIQDAIHAAAEGDTILVWSGTYAPIEIATDNLTIQAVGGGDAIIDGMGVPGFNGVTLNANGVVIRRLVVQNMARDPDTRAGGNAFEVNGTGNRFYGNTARNSRFGFVVSADSNLFVGNTGSDNEVNGFQITTSNNTLINNTGNRNNNGFTLSTGTGNTFRGNLAEGNNFRGFFLVFFPENNTLEGNIARGNGESGFLLVFGANSNRLLGNRAEGNGVDMHSDDNFGFVVARESDGNLLQGNVARANTGEGFGVGECNFNTLRANLAEFNGEGGFLLEDVTLASSFDGGGTTFNTFKSNTARANGGDGFRILNGASGKVHSAGGGLSSETEDNPTDPTDFNVFETNTSIQNAGWGYFVETLLSNTFQNNHCQLNDLGGANVPEICR